MEHPLFRARMFFLYLLQEIFCIFPLGGSIYWAWTFHNRYLVLVTDPDECVAYTKRLCDELGRDGGFILSEGKMLSYRNDAKAENYKAVCDFVSSYRL